MAIQIDLNNVIEPESLGRGVGLFNGDALLRGLGTNAVVPPTATLLTEPIRVTGATRLTLRVVANIPAAVQLAVNQVTVLADDGTVEAGIGLRVGTLIGTGSPAAYVVNWGRLGGSTGFTFIDDVLAIILLAFANPGVTQARLQNPRLYVAA